MYRSLAVVAKKQVWRLKRQFWDNFDNYFENFLNENFLKKIWTNIILIIKCSIEQ